jgi:hypothetical protein
MFPVRTLGVYLDHCKSRLDDANKNLSNRSGARGAGWETRGERDIERCICMHVHVCICTVCTHLRKCACVCVGAFSHSDKDEGGSAETEKENYIFKTPVEFWCLQVQRLYPCATVQDRGVGNARYASRL